jgi:hypothetical protein
MWAQTQQLVLFELSHWSDGSGGRDGDELREFPKGFRDIKTGGFTSALYIMALGTSFA